MIIVLIPIFLGFALLVFILLISRKKTWLKPTEGLMKEYKDILEEKVCFYRNLEAADKLKFETRVQEFLLNYEIIGVECDVSVQDNLMVAASAVVPIFNVENWHYANLSKVLLYPTHFDENHSVTANKRSILGMVGTGHMTDKMILSKVALKHGFKNEFDKRNTAIHEFVHLIDMRDGKIDGIPELLLERQYVLPWLDLIKSEILKINKGKSPIRKYGATNSAEFFAVSAEFFFERPRLLEKKHPELFKYMDKMFNSKIDS